MQRLLSAITVISILLIQLHALSHLSTKNTKKHHKCPICEVQAHNVAIEAFSPKFEINILIEPDIINFDSVLKPKTLSFSTRRSRAPPLIA